MASHIMLAHSRLLNCVSLFFPFFPMDFQRKRHCSQANNELHYDSLHEKRFTYWSSHNNFCSLLKCFRLFILVTTTKYSCSMDVVHFSKPPRLDKDLLAKFSCRGTDECNGPITRLKLGLIHDMDQRWPQESCSLTRTCFSNANNISTTEGNGNSLK